MYCLFCHFAGLASVRDGVHVPPTPGHKRGTLFVPLQWHLLPKNIFYCLKNQLLSLYCSQVRALLLLRPVYRRLHLPKHHRSGHSYSSHSPRTNLHRQLPHLQGQSLPDVQNNRKYRFYYRRNPSAHYLRLFRWHNHQRRIHQHRIWTQLPFHPYDHQWNRKVLLLTVQKSQIIYYGPLWLRVKRRTWKLR